VRSIAGFLAFCSGGMFLFFNLCPRCVSRSACDEGVSFAVCGCRVFAR
jgi:hypothetical protein